MDEEEDQNPQKLDPLYDLSRAFLFKKSSHEEIYLIIRYISRNIIPGRRIHHQELPAEVDFLEAISMLR